MRLQEIIFQGLFDCRTPVRIKPTKSFATVELPPGVRAKDVQDLLISILYSSHTPQELRLDYSSASDVKVAAIFEHRKRKYRLLRRTDLSSLTVQVEEESGFRDVTTDDPETFLQQSLGLPDFEVFWCLNLWRFDEAPSSASSVDFATLDQKTRDLVDKYRVAHTVEALEDEITRYESLIGDTKKELGQGAALQEKLEKARERLEELEVEELSQNDLQLIREKDERLADFEHQVSRLANEEDSERNQVDLTLPERPWRMPLFWVGLTIGVGALAISLLQPAQFRPLALADIVGFGICAWILVNYFSDMERASVHQIRLESIKRRLNQVREEQVSLQERVNHLMIHAGVRDAKELTERVTKSEKLRQIVAQMEEKVEELRRDPDYVNAQEKLSELEDTLEKLQERRADLPESPISAFQLETDLKDMGIDPVKILEATESKEEETEEEATPIERLIDVARETGQWVDGKLHDRTRQMWGKICGHVLGARFSEVELTGGELRVGDLDREQLQMWQETRPSESRVLYDALALSLLVNAVDRTRKGHFETLVIPHVLQELTGAQVKKFESVFKSASKKCSIVLCLEESW